MAERVIWERTIDQAKISARTERFHKRFFPAAAVILLVALIFTGWQNAIGVLLLLATVGFFWRTTVRYQSLSDAANPVMTVGDGRLILGERTVVIEEVQRFTCLATAMQTSMLGRHSQIKLGKAIFRMEEPDTNGDPQLIEFGWPNMAEDGVASVRAALEPELKGKWVEPDGMLDESEIRKRIRRPRLSDQYRQKRTSY